MIEENQKNLGNYHIDDLGKTATFFFPKDNQDMKRSNPSNEYKEIIQNEGPSNTTGIKKSSQMGTGTKSPSIYSYLPKDQEQENRINSGRDQFSAEGIRQKNGSIGINRRLNNAAVLNAQGLLDSRQTWRITKNGSPQAKGQSNPLLERQDYQSPPKKQWQISDCVIQSQQQFQSAPQNEEHQLPFDATFNFTAQQSLQRNMMITKLPSISVQKNQQTIGSIESSAPNSTKQYISQFSSNPKNMAKYAQINLANHDPTVKQLGDQKQMAIMSSSLRNRKIVQNQLSLEQPTLFTKQFNGKSNKISSNNFGDALPMQNNSNSTQEATPEMSLQNGNIGSPGEQQKQSNRIGSNRNNQTMSPPTEDQFLSGTNKFGTRGSVFSPKGDGQMRQKYDSIGQSTLKRQISPDPETQYSSLKTYFQENYNSGIGQEDLSMKRQNSISSLQMQKKIQLDPIKAPISLGGGGTSDTINYQSQTKKFLTRKPQTKILNRVFSSKADIKPNKNIVFKNIPQTANSLQTTDSPLFVFESELSHVDLNKQNGSGNVFKQNTFQDSQLYNKFNYGSSDTTINSNYSIENGIQLQNNLIKRNQHLNAINSNSNTNDLLHDMPITKSIRPRFQHNQPKFFSAPTVNKEEKDQDTIQCDQGKKLPDKSSFDQSLHRTLNSNPNNIKAYPFNQLHFQQQQIQQQQMIQSLQQRTIQHKSSCEGLNNIPQYSMNLHQNIQSPANNQHNTLIYQQYNPISPTNPQMPETLQQLANFKISKTTFKPFNLQSTLKKN